MQEKEEDDDEKETKHSLYGQAYREQGQRFKDAGVHMYGMGVQSHFGHGVEPNPVLIKVGIASASFL